MKKKILTLALVVVMIAIMLTSFTMAYFTDTDSDTNVMTVGNVTIEQNEYMREKDADGNLTGKLIAYVDQPIVPAVIYDNQGNVTPDWGASAYAEDTTRQYTIDGLNDTFQMPDPSRMRNVVDKIVTVTNTGDNDAYVRTILLIEDTEENVMPNLEMLYDSTLSCNMVGYVKLGNVQYYAIEFIYANKVVPGETTLPSCMAFWMNPSVKETGVPEQINIIAYSQAVQADGFDNAKVALDTAFGKVTAENTGWYVTE